MSLNGFQVLFGGLMLFSVAMIFVGVRRRAVTRREGLFWTALFLAAGAAVLWPEAISGVARWLGIGRGADLVSYLAILVMFLGFFVTYMRLRSLRRELTLLVRRIALAEAATDDSEATR